jgi:hypothetical protein
LVPAAYVLQLVALLGEEGVARRTCCATDLKPPALAERDALITNSDQLRIYDERSRSRASRLGLRLGARLRLEHHGVVGHAMLCSDNLRQAMHVLVRYTVLRGFR